MNHAVKNKITGESISTSVILGKDELSHDKRSFVPPCQDPPTHRHRLRTDKYCAALANIWGLRCVTYRTVIFE